MLRLNEMSDSAEPLGAPFVYFLRGQMGKLTDFVSKGVRLIVVDHHTFIARNRCSTCCDVPESCGAGFSLTRGKP